ncbi:MAG: hypothetical protein R3C14_21090 [Caldilineaceae bacterium]
MSESQALNPKLLDFQSRELVTIAALASMIGTRDNCSFILV